MVLKAESRKNGKRKEKPRNFLELKKEQGLQVLLNQEVNKPTPKRLQNIKEKGNYIYIYMTAIRLAADFSAGKLIPGDNGRLFTKQ